MTATAIVIHPTTNPTDGATTWSVWVEFDGRQGMKFQRKTARCVCDVVDILATKHPEAPISYVIR